MKCPYQTIIIHKPESTRNYVKYYAEDITEFGECYKSECPFYYTSWEHETVEHCRRAEGIEK